MTRNLEIPFQKGQIGRIITDLCGTIRANLLASRFISFEFI